MPKLNLLERLHYYHRLWRYARRTEPDTIGFIKRLVRAGECAVDIGANKGIISWYLARAVGRGGRVLAFEPQPELGPYLEKVKGSFGLRQVEVINKGLAEEAGEMTLHREHAGSTATMSGESEASKEVIRVEVLPLDRALKDAGDPQVHFIKCDVDGFEYSVFCGARRTLERCRPALLIELFATHLPQMAEMLEGLGYHGAFFQHQGRMYRAGETQRVAYRHEHAKFRNFVFLHESDSRGEALAEAAGGKRPEACGV